MTLLFSSMPMGLLKSPSSIFLDRKTGTIPEVVGVVVALAEVVEVVAAVDQAVVAVLEVEVEGRSAEWMIFEDQSARVVSEEGYRLPLF